MAADIVDVIAHSPGAIITLDLILTGRLSIAGLVTFAGRGDPCPRSDAQPDVPDFGRALAASGC